ASGDEAIGEAPSEPPLEAAPEPEPVELPVAARTGEADPSSPSIWSAAEPPGPPVLEPPIPDPALSAAPEDGEPPTELDAELAPEPHGSAEQEPEPSHATYFRAAGDPDEPPPAPDRSLGAQFEAFWSGLESYWGPRFSRFGKHAQALSGEVAN